MEAVKPDASGGDRMNPLMTISTALYVCEGCDDAGNEGNCYHADQLRHAPTHQWLCETCYDDAKAEDDSSEGWPAWDELVRHPCMAAELIEARLAIAHMHDMIAAHGQPLMICEGCGCTMTDEEVMAGRAAGQFLSCCPERRMRVATREDWDHWMKVSDEIEKELREAALLKSRAQGQPAAPAVKVQIPDDIRNAVLARGKVEWGSVPEKPDAEHVENFANTLRLTREHFGTEGNQRLDGVYLAGTDIVICHTGTSPIHAQAITDAVRQVACSLHLPYHNTTG